MEIFTRTGLGGVSNFQPQLQPPSQNFYRNWFKLEITVVIEVEVYLGTYPPIR